MKSDLDIRAVLSNIGRTFSKYQVLFFFIVISLLVAVALIMIVRLFTATPETTSVDGAAAPTDLISTENKETVEKLRRLRSSDDLEDIPAPSGRFSPFSETPWRTDIMER